MNESCHTHAPQGARTASNLYEWVMSHVWMSRVTHTHHRARVHLPTCINGRCHTYEWVVSHTRTTGRAYSSQTKHTRTSSRGRSKTTSAWPLICTHCWIFFLDSLFFLGAWQYFILFFSCGSGEQVREPWSAWIVYYYYIFFFFLVSWQYEYNDFFCMELEKSLHALVFLVQLL